MSPNILKYPTPCIADLIIIKKHISGFMYQCGWFFSETGKNKLIMIELVKQITIN